MKRRFLAVGFILLVTVGPILVGCSSTSAPPPTAAAVSPAAGNGSGQGKGAGQQGGLADLVVTAVQGSSITAKTTTGQIKTITVTSTTTITRAGQSVKVDAIKAGDHLKVTGKPGTGTNKDVVAAQTIAVLR